VDVRRVGRGRIQKLRRHLLVLTIVSYYTFSGRPAGDLRVVLIAIKNNARRQVYIIILCIVWLHRKSTVGIHTMCPATQIVVRLTVKSIAWRRSLATESMISGRGGGDVGSVTPRSRIDYVYTLSAVPH